MKVTRVILTTALCLLAVGLQAVSNPPIKMNIRRTTSDGPNRKADTMFALAQTYGFSIVKKDNLYWLNGATHQRRAWDQSLGSQYDLVFPDPNWCVGCANPMPQHPCGQYKGPSYAGYDDRCGDSTGGWWISTTPSSTNWSYADAVNPASTHTIPNFPTPNVWPYRWGSGTSPLDYPKTGIPNFATTVDAKKINTAIPASVAQTIRPANLPGCYRMTWNQDFVALGAGNAKVVNAGGVWYMAVNETINNPDSNANWTAGDTWRVLWAKSTDGKTWQIQPSVLFRSASEDDDCHLGLMVTQLFVDTDTSSGVKYFYLVAQDLAAPTNDPYPSWTVLMRAPVQTSTTWGYGQWQIAVDNGTAAVSWQNVSPGQRLDMTRRLKQTGAAIQPYRLTPSVNQVDVKQTAIARVFVPGPVPNGSRFIALTRGDNNGIQLWSAPNLNTKFEYESDVDVTPNASDPTRLMPQGLNGFEIAFTHVDGNTAMAPKLLSNELDVWLVGNFRTDPNDATNTRELVVYRTTATLSGGNYSKRVALRTSGGNYISATNGGGSTVTAQASAVLAHETFTMIDSDAGALVDGDEVSLLTAKGYYVVADNGGGSTVSANRAGAGAWETFTVIKLGGSAGTTVNSGDPIALRSYYNYYLVAENGGAGAANWNRTAPGPWETFTYLPQP